MAAEPIYPLAPKSTRYLLRGQFWAIPIEGGRFGAGCVVGAHTKDGKKSSRMFIAGVVRWVGNEPPTKTDLKGLPIEKFAFAHLKVFTDAKYILGEAELQFQDEPESAESLELPTWGFGVPKLLAERLAIGPANQSFQATTYGRA